MAGADAPAPESAPEPGGQSCIAKDCASNGLCRLALPRGTAAGPEWPPCFVPKPQNRAGALVGHRRRYQMEVPPAVHHFCSFNHQRIPVLNVRVLFGKEPARPQNDRDAVGWSLKRQGAGTAANRDVHLRNIPVAWITVFRSNPGLTGDPHQKPSAAGAVEGTAIVIPSDIPTIRSRMGIAPARPYGQVRWCCSAYPLSPPGRGLPAESVSSCEDHSTCRLLHHQSTFPLLPAAGFLGSHPVPGIRGDTE